MSSCPSGFQSDSATFGVSLYTYPATSTRKGRKTGKRPLSSFVSVFPILPLHSRNPISPSPSLSTSSITFPLNPNISPCPYQPPLLLRLVYSFWASSYSSSSSSSSCSGGTLMRWTKHGWRNSVWLNSTWSGMGEAKIGAFCLLFLFFLFLWFLDFFFPFSFPSHFVLWNFY